MVETIYQQMMKEYEHTCHLHDQQGHDQEREMLRIQTLPVSDRSSEERSYLAAYQRYEQNMRRMSSIESEIAQMKHAQPGSLSPEALRRLSLASEIERRNEERKRFVQVNNELCEKFGIVTIDAEIRHAVRMKEHSLVWEKEIGMEQNRNATPLQDSPGDTTVASPASIFGAFSPETLRKAGLSPVLAKTNTASMAAIRTALKPSVVDSSASHPPMETASQLRSADTGSGSGLKEGRMQTALQQISSKLNAIERLQMQRLLESGILGEFLQAYLSQALVE